MSSSSDQAPRSEIQPDTLVGGKLRLIQRIGRGGMGEVWVARNEATHAEVAVKTLQRSERKTIQEERFRREARLAATITHRHVVRIFDLVEEPDGMLGLVMELLRGGTLEATLLDVGSMPTTLALAVVLPILSALQHVHDKGIIHRDVKPSNIFFSVEPDGHVIPKILDFGIAKLPAKGAGLTVDGSVLGTPHYMSPEQIRGNEDIDGRSDMFSVAVVLHEMLTGTRVFQRDLAGGSLAAVLEEEVDPDPNIDPRLWFVLARALAKRPYERFASCTEFADALVKASGVTDADLAAALRGIEPRMDEVPEASHTHFDAVSIIPRAASRRRTVVWTAIAASVAATVAVLATLALVRPTETEHRASASTEGVTTTESAAHVDSLRESPSPEPSAAIAVTPPAVSASAVPVMPARPAVAVSSSSARSTKPSRANESKAAAKTSPGARPIATTPGF